MTEIVFDTRGVKAAEVQEALRDLFADPSADPAVLRDAADNDIDAGELAAVKPEDVKVESRGSGLGGMGEEIVVGIAVEVGAHIVTAILIPYLQRCFGSRFGRRREADEST